MPDLPAREPVADHDHAACVRTAIDRAGALCLRNGARLTPLRREVLEIVWRGHRPVGAYEVLAALGRSRQRAAPPTVYRALDFLMEQGLVHRIESLNAFIGCDRPGHEHRGMFLLCEGCGQATEIEDPGLLAQLSARAAAAGFAPRRVTIEVGGHCAACRQPA